MAAEQFTFQTEIKQLLQILSHSLYQNRDIALRELVSNASDSLSKARRLRLTDEALKQVETPLEIHLDVDRDARVLSIRDNGVGMSRDELIANLGTIAKSGSLEFLSKLAKESQAEVGLIGQFGVGFYSAFMLADCVEVTTRGVGQSDAWTWKSSGDGSYSIEASPDDTPVGAVVKLHLKPNVEQSGEEVHFDDFLDGEHLRSVVQRYSSYVPFPILFGEERLNAQRPIWVEPKDSLSDADYEGFYQYLTHRGDKPIWRLHWTSDYPLQFQAVLFCPGTNFEKLGMGRSEHGLSLCAKRILVQHDNKQLLPEYLHFLYGLVDSADLPLNVSRETLQNERVIPKLCKALTRKTLDSLAEFAAERPEEYRNFYQEFGSILRTGLGVDWENRERIAKLMRVHSSHAATETDFVSLDEYIERAGESQQQIYYLGGPNLESIARSPHLEAYRERGAEVLFLTDPVDEWALAHLREYRDKTLVSIDSANAELPPKKSADGSTDPKPDEPAEKPPVVGFSRVIELFKLALGDRVIDVRESKRLTNSAVCLMNPSDGMSAQLQRALSQSMKDFTFSKRIVEVNPHFPLIERLCQLTASGQHDAFIQDVGRQLVSNAFLLDGVVVDPRETADRVQRLLEELANQRSSIIV